MDVNLELLRRGLPKWPALVVVGEKITKEQAYEVLVRTHQWYLGTNDREWERIVYNLLGVPMVTSKDGYKHVDHDALSRVREELQVLGLEYLNNSRVASAWIGGPHGWCDWEGNIGSNNYNIGKWPSIEEVLEEWSSIAAAFPFLNLRSQLWSGETCEEGHPVVEFVVKDGAVKLVEPQPMPRPTECDDLGVVFRKGGERGCTAVQLKAAIELVRKKLSVG